ncbi:MAG: SDR family oxidoreductase [Acidobacteria bacterium]|nr:SDR family oxidoreductase [Acidobacteriota bacterium]
MADDRFSLAGRVAIVTGGYGVLGGVLAASLAGAGVRVAVVGRRRDALDDKIQALREAGGDVLPIVADVVDEGQMAAGRDEVLRAWGRIDILINGAGGNVPAARNDGRPIFDVPLAAFDDVLRLNLHGTIVPSLVVGQAMAERRAGVIVNLSSMAADRAITGAMGYGVAKGAIDTFTRWLAMDLARRYGAGLRVNAVAPGFFLGNQNRRLLVNEDGAYTDRGRTIVDLTPMGRFGRADELVGPVHWLCSDAASFVTGAVIPVDGGFSAFSGV